MAFTLQIVPYTLQFRFDARTSRGAMQQHRVWFLLLSEKNSLQPPGIGECAPLPGLSPDASAIGQTLTEIADRFNAADFRTLTEVEEAIRNVEASRFPSIRFALETALLDYQCGSSQVLLPSDFTAGEAGIPINGLVWMGDKNWMQEQVREKIAKGFTCLKLKIGALDFEEELAVLKWIRREYSAHDLTLRLDANGAFAATEALAKLERLESLGIHSIEQPIKQGQWEQMAALCAQTPIPIALDEELIGDQSPEHKKRLLSTLKPQYIILKPTLTGGLTSTREWIRFAEQQQIPWWLTSALESNIGLNAISQLAGQLQTTMPQGLGTGQLYHNNLESPLEVENGHLFYRKEQQWNLSDIINQ